MSEEKFNVKHFAQLARLSLCEDEISHLQTQMDDILGMVSELSELDLENVEETIYPVALQNKFRKDEVGTSLPQEVTVATFPENEDESNVVPVMIEGNE